MIYMPTKAVERKFIITLKYRKKRYSFCNQFSTFSTNKYGWEARYLAEWMYTEGNYGCDCNKSNFIRYSCDGKFPKMSCGDKIKLLSIREPHQRRIRRRQIAIMQRKIT